MSIRHVTGHVWHLALHAMHGHLALHLHTSHSWLHLSSSWNHEDLHVWMELLLLLLRLLLLRLLLLLTRSLSSDSSHLASHHILRHHHVLHGLEDIPTAVSSTGTLSTGCGTGTTRVPLASTASSSTMRHHLGSMLSSLCCLLVTTHLERNHGAISRHTR